MCIRDRSATAQKDFANIITLLLGITISSKMRAADFVNIQTIIIMLLGLLAFVFDTIGGVPVSYTPLDVYKRQALMSPTTNLQGESIPGIGHLIHITA